MPTTLECNACGKHMATLRDASVRKGMIVYCAPCHASMQRMMDKPSQKDADIPDFLSQLFRPKPTKY